MRVLLVALLLETEIPAARALYEKALASWKTRTEEGLEESLRLFQGAVTLDPRFAEAHAGIADASCLLALYGYEAPKDVMPRAREAAMEALRLDESLAKAHASLGLVRYLYEWSFGDAEKSFEKAIALDRGYSSAHHWLAMMLMATGRYEESLREIDEAIVLEPESPLYQVKRGTILMAAGRLDEAEAHLKSIDSDLARRELGLLALQRNDIPRALDYLKASGSEASYGLVLGLLGRKDDARSVLESLEEGRSRGFVSPIDFALVHVGLGEHEKALEELERAYGLRDPALVYLRSQPGLGLLRSEPRFQEILHRIGI